MTNKEQIEIAMLKNSLRKIANNCYVLRRALRKIANDAYDREDEYLINPQPMMIWQLVALAALKETE
jgi:hypothetical protein